MQAILETHDAHANRTVTQIRITRLLHSVVIDVDHVIEHAHCSVDGFLQLVVIKLAIFHVRRQIDRAQIADSDFGIIGIQRDLGAQVGTVNHAHVLLGRANIARILEGDPGMASLEQHREHLAPQIQRLNFLEQLELATGGLCFVAQISGLEFLAKLVVQVLDIGRREQGPITFFHHALHEQIGNPVRRVHVVRTTTIITSIFTQIEEFLDIHVPGFEIRTDCTLALATLIDCNSGVIHHFQERHNTLRFAIGAFDMRTQRAHWCPVITQTTGVFGQQCIFLDRFVNAIQIVRDRGQVAGREL